MIFLFARSDILNPCYGTSEPCEHTFGGWRAEEGKQEATVLECIEIEDKRSCKVKAIFESQLTVSRQPNRGYGYQATWPSFVNTAMERPGNEGGPSSVQCNEIPLIHILWPIIQPIINKCSRNMMSLLRFLGVDDDELLPFCKERERAQLRCSPCSMTTPQQTHHLMTLWQRRGI